MRQTLELVRGDVGKLVENERTEEKYKKAGLKKLQESMAVMNEAESGCEAMINGEKTASRTLRRLTAKEFDDLDGYLNDKQRKIRSLEKQQSQFEAKARKSRIPAEAQGFDATAKSIGRQVEKLKVELEMQQKKVDQLKSFKQMLETNQQAISDVLQRNITPELNDVKKVFADLRRLRQTGLSHVEKDFNTRYQSLVTAFEKNTVAAKLADPKNSPEEVIGDETVELGSVFAGMISIMATSKEFYEKTALPMLKDASLVVDKTKNIEVSLEYIDKAIMNLTNAFDKFDEACVDLQDDPKKKLELQQIKKLEDAKTLEENLKQQKEANIPSQFDKVKAGILQDIQAVQNHLTAIQQEMDGLNMLQKAVLGRLETLQNVLAASQEKKEVEADRKIEEAEKSAGAAATAISAAAGRPPPGA
jgi:hypothetical protein